MKKLLTACAVAGLSAAVFGDVTSANVVGYAGVATEENRAPVIGGMFIPVAEGETYDLRTCTIVGDEGEYCDPGSEFLRVLDPNSSANKARYTYCSKEWMDDNFDYPEQSYWAIGWWNYDPSVDYQELIESDKDDTLMVKSAIDIDIGMAFLGNFSKGHSLRLQSSGAVPATSRGVATAENRAPMIANMMPSDTTLFSMSITGEEGEYCDPGSEFLRVLDPNSSANKFRYTYCSKEWMDDNFDYPEQSYWAIGWWNYDPSVDYQELIESDKDDTLMVKDDVPVPAGFGFLGNFSKGHSLDVNFKSPLEKDAE